MDPYVISPGDSLITRCYYDTKTKAGVTFGLGSEQEMCIDFLYYYPADASIKEHCTHGSGGVFGGTYDGKTVISDASDPGMRVFGVNTGTLVCVCVVVMRTLDVAML